MWLLVAAGQVVGEYANKAHAEEQAAGLGVAKPWSVVEGNEAAFMEQAEAEFAKQYPAFRLKADCTFHAESLEEVFAALADHFAEMADLEKDESPSDLSSAFPRFRGSFSIDRED